MEALLSEEGVPKWMEKLGAALMLLFQDRRAAEGMKPIQFLSNEVWAAMWDMKESYANKYHQKFKERQDTGGRDSQSQVSRLREKHNMSGEEMLDRGGRKCREKTKAGHFWFVEYEGNKFYITKARDAYNVQKDPPEKYRECGKGYRVWTYDLVGRGEIPGGAGRPGSPTVSHSDPGEDRTLEKQSPASRRRGPQPSWRPNAGTEPDGVRYNRQATLHNEEGAGGGESDRRSRAEEDNQWRFPTSWPAYRTLGAVLGGIV